MRRRVLVLVVAVLTVLAGLTFAPAQADTAPEPESPFPATVSADPLPTTQIDPNGIVWTQAVAGSKVYAGGQFTSARPAGAAAGTNESPRSNLLAYNIETGVLDAGFAPEVNGRVLGASVSPDGSRLYVAGAFTAVNGVNRYRLAAFNTQTGQLITTWNPGTNSLVNDIFATEDTVYIAGQFTNVNNTARTGVAALDTATGALKSFNPTLAGGTARAVVTSPDRSKIAVGGNFTSANGSTRPGRGLAVFDRDGNLVPWAMNNTIRNAGANSAIYSLAADEDGLYGSGYDFGGSKTEDDFEGTFRSDWDGNLVWMEDCHGDSYSLFPFKGAVYKATHSHYCGNIGEFPQLDPWHVNHSLAFAKIPSGRTITPDIWGYRSFTGQPAAKLLHWYPEWGTGSVSGVGQAGWDVSAGGDYLLYGGEFTRVNGVRQQGLVRFALADKAPNKSAPAVVSPEWAPSLKSIRAGQARIAWPANHDADNAKLTYQVFRRGTTEPIHTSEPTASTFWVRPSMGYVDKDARPGVTEEYRVRAIDPFGNFVQTAWTPVEIATTTVSTPLADAVLGDNPVSYWPLSETSGTSVFDWAGLNDMTTSGSVTRNQTGPQLGQSSLATRFSGSNSFAAATTAEDGPSVFSVEAWFRTSSTSGGKIVGFGDKQTGTSSSYDRHIYLSGNGTVRFGVYPGSTSVISSGTGFNDNQWHHVVGTLGPNGQSLFVDGVLIGTLPNTSAQAYRGYWRVGGDSVSSWPGAGNSYLNGTISDVAVYDRVLGRTEVDRHWVASGRTSSIPAAPADQYGAAVYGRDPQLYWRLSDGSSSTASDAGPGGLDGTYQQTGRSIARSETGALSAVSNASVRFSSSKNFLGIWSNRQTIVSKRAVPSPASFAIETWFKTSSSTSGKLIGFGNSNSNTANASSSYDRHVYMDPAGRVKFGVWNGAEQVLQSSSTNYRDGAWHHVVAQQSDTGMQLYIDGALVGQNSVTTADSFDGYWRLGGDTTWEGDPFWVGNLDEVVVYRRALTSNEVRADYELGKTGQLNTPPTAAFTTEVNDLTAEFDSRGSTDVQGPVVGYAWTFGDGQTSTAANPTHTYGAPGQYDVTLKVTDAGGLTGEVTRRIDVLGPNAKPQPAFSVSKQNRKVALDASASSDPDGTIESYAWDFGDGSTGNGITAEHTYDEDGTYKIALTVTDNRGATERLERTVDVEVPNVAPVADFSVEKDGLRVVADGSASADSDGAVAAYDWRFGDGQTATGRTVEHTYDAAGTYEIRLTVTDDDGAEHAVTKSVTVTEPPAEDELALDAFGRTVTGGWGTADRGGAWTVSGGAAAFSVSGAAGHISLAPSHTREARLASVSTENAVSTAVYSVDQASAGGTLSLTALGRLVGSNEYAARIRLEPSGVVRLQLLRNQTELGGGSVVLANTYTPGAKLNVKVSARGTSPTTLGAKAWFEGQPEPVNWQLSATDSAAGLQTAGVVGVRAALSSVSTVPTTRFNFDSFRVVSGNAPASNVAPVADFSVEKDGLRVVADGSASTDSDGSIASYAWRFGDGATATGRNASHTYGAAGTYDIRLTVTDDDGAEHAVTKSVTVTEPQADEELALDAFGRTLTGTWGSADRGGAWTMSGGAAAFSVNGGAGHIALAPSHTREARLASTSTQDAVVTSVFSVDQASAGGTFSLTTLGRLVGANEYAARIRLEPSGVVRLQLLRNQTELGGGSVVLANTYTPGAKLNVKVSARGTSPTTLGAKAWFGGQPEPVNWQLSATDSAADLQAAGIVGVRAAVSSVSTVPATRISFDSFRATR